MGKLPKTIYYSDTNEEHSGTKMAIKKPIDKNYKYINKNIFYRIFTFFVYRFIATPVAFVYSKLFKRISIRNKKVLKWCKGSGYFVYANHTHQFSDAFSPHIALFPKKVYTIVNPENVNVPLLGGSTKMLGAIPIPTNMNGSRNFMNAIEKRVLQGNAVLIYPEAHIWPYYTKIRPFTSTSFRYPVKYREASYCMTTTYQKGFSKKRPKIVIYIDGPFYPNEALDIKAQQETLRNEILNCMIERSKLSTFETINYIKRENK